jgi:hypothetical protein
VYELGAKIRQNSIGLINILVPMVASVRILVCKPNKIKDKEYHKMKNETYKNLRDSFNLTTSMGKYKSILPSNVRITTSLEKQLKSFCYKKKHLTYSHLLSACTFMGLFFFSYSFFFFLSCGGVY